MIVFRTNGPPVRSAWVIVIRLVPLVNCSQTARNYHPRFPNIADR
jgi:hypothetical protein